MIGYPPRSRLWASSNPPRTDRNKPGAYHFHTHEADRPSGADHSLLQHDRIITDLFTRSHRRRWWNHAVAVGSGLV